MPEIAHNSTVRPIWTAGPPPTLCQCAHKLYTKALSSPFSPPPTYPRNMHDSTFVPVSAAPDVPVNRTRPYRADRARTRFPGRPALAFLSDRTKAVLGSRRRPLSLQPSAGPRGPAPQARPGPSGPDPTSSPRPLTVIPDYRTPDLRAVPADRTASQAGKSAPPAWHDPAARSGFPPVRTWPESLSVIHRSLQLLDLPGPSGPDPVRISKAGRARSRHGPKICQQEIVTLRPRQASRPYHLGTSRPPNPSFRWFERSPSQPRISTALRSVAGSGSPPD